MKYLKFTIVLVLIIMQMHAQSNNTIIYSGVDRTTKILMADGTEKEIYKIREGDNIKTAYIDSIEVTLDTGRVKKLVEFTEANIANIVLLNDAHLSFTDNLPLLTKYEVARCEKWGENGHVEFLTRYNQWAVGIINQTGKTPTKEISMPQINKNKLMCFISKDEIPKTVFIKTFKQGATPNSNTMYTLELENGNTFIANGFIVKTK